MVRDTLNDEVLKQLGKGAVLGDDILLQHLFKPLAARVRDLLHHVFATAQKPGFDPLASPQAPARINDGLRVFRL